jgi:hypothetical protein
MAFTKSAVSHLAAGIELAERDLSIPYMPLSQSRTASEGKISPNSLAPGWVSDPSPLCGFSAKATGRRTSYEAGTRAGAAHEICPQSNIAASVSRTSWVRFSKGRVPASD